MIPWTPDTPDVPVRIGVLGYAMALLRGAAVGIVTYGGLLVLLAMRLIERPVFGSARPLTSPISRAVCRINIALMGLGYSVVGRPMTGRGAIVCNHVSWLDIFALNACQSIYFVSKAEVARWPGIGWLARATGTVFIARDPRAAKEQQILFESRLRSGHRMLFFPEGTSTDGLRVLRFKSTLFAAFFHDHLVCDMMIQPVSLIYHAPKSADLRFYGWWGDMSFGPHFLRVLANPRQGRIEVIFHAPMRVADHASRKDLAQHCETKVRAALRERLGPDYQG